MRVRCMGGEGRTHRVIAGLVPVVERHLDLVFVVEVVLILDVLLFDPPHGGRVCLADGGCIDGGAMDPPVELGLRGEAFDERPVSKASIGGDCVACKDVVISLSLLVCSLSLSHLPHIPQVYGNADGDDELEEGHHDRNVSMTSTDAEREREKGAEGEENCQGKGDLKIF